MIQEREKMKTRYLILTAVATLFTTNAFAEPTYSYDGQGRVIEEYRDSDKYTYTYDESGNKTSVFKYTSCSGSSCDLSSKTEYTYDTNNNKISSSYFECSGSSCNLSSKYEYAYDGNGNQISYSIYSCSTGSCDLNSKEEYTYDGNGKKISSLYYECAEGSCNLVHKYEYTYDENGNQISSYYECSDGSCRLSSEEEHANDESGNKNSTDSSGDNTTIEAPRSQLEFSNVTGGNQASSYNMSYGNSVSNPRPAGNGGYNQAVSNAASGQSCPLGVDACGECGPGCIWKKVGTSLSVISVSDDAVVKDFYENNAPWTDMNDITFINIEGTFQNIGKNSLYGNGTGHMNMPHSIASIASNALIYNANFQAVTVGDGVRTIDPKAFNIPHDTKIYCHNTSKSRCSNLIGSSNQGSFGKLIVFEKDSNTGEIKVGTRKYASFEDLINGKHIKRRKYTFEEAKELVKASGKKSLNLKLNYR